MNDVRKTEYDAAYEAGRIAGANTKVQWLGPNSEIPYMLVPEGYAVRDLSNLLPDPLNIDQLTTLYDGASFAAYVNRFKDGRTLVFADPHGSSFKAELDFHTADQPSKCEHSAGLGLKLSPEWTAWQGKEGVALDPQSLARFIEEQLPVIHEPSGAVLLTAIRHFRAERNVSYNKVLSNMDNSTLELNYSDGTRATSEIEVPAEFKLLLPVFRHGTPAEMVVKVEWKLLDEGKIQFTLRRQRPDDVKDAAFKTACDEIQKATDVPLLLGAA